MEWIKRMKLKKALFTLTFINLSIATVLSILAFLGCNQLGMSIAPQGVTLNVNLKSIERVELPEPSAEAVRIGEICSVLQIALPILFFIVALLATASLFYRWKLKEPLAILADSANRIMDNDLDFEIEAKNNDELGRLCTAFETMRQSLLKNHRELWRQAQERKRLNAAFSHDLRNPVTVLKGSVKMARQCAAGGEEHRELLLENLARIESYTNRIERYVEMMSNIQRLEQMQINRVQVEYAVLAEELKGALSFAAEDSKKQLFTCEGDRFSVMLDKHVLFEIAENLVSNGLRFAEQKVTVSLHIDLEEPELLILEVADDGNGFPARLLQNGVQPFQKYGEEAEHFGMGLYICELLCGKHGGSLIIENRGSGAVARAILKII